jgi:predicted TIM-barrel fold metal-dependent hydrolase
MNKDQSKVSRRGLLYGLAGAALGAARGILSAQNANPAPNRSDPRRLDVHNHFGSPRWIKRVLDLKPQGWNRFDGWTPAKHLEMMDKGYVRTGFVSATEPGVWFGDDYSSNSPQREEAISLARDMNEYGTRMKSDYKGRFGLWAVLPIPDVDASLKEIEYAFDTLHADGVGLLTSYGNMWLGDEKLQPIFDELNRRNAIVYVHPTDSNCCHSLAHASPGTVEWLSDTGRSINSLVSTAAPYDGGPTPPVGREGMPRMSAATRYANVKFIWSHGGGSLLGIANRVAGFNQSNDILEKPAVPNSKLWHIRRFYYDTAQAANPILMQGMKALVGMSQIVFGSDCPYVEPAVYNRTLLQCGFSAEELRAVDRENALRFLPTYRRI